MKDFKPHNWKGEPKKPAPTPRVERELIVEREGFDEAGAVPHHDRWREVLDGLAEGGDVPLWEVG